MSVGILSVGILYVGILSVGIMSFKLFLPRMDSLSSWLPFEGRKKNLRKNEG